MRSQGAEDDAGDEENLGVGRFDQLACTPAAQVHLCGVTTNPVGDWVTEQARNLATAFDEPGRAVGHLIRDRDAKFTRSFDDAWASIGAQVVRTPVRAPNANAYTEGWVGTARRECLDHLLIVGPGHLARVLSEFVEHDNAHRPHLHGHDRPSRCCDPRRAPSQAWRPPLFTGPSNAAATTGSAVPRVNRQCRPGAGGLRPPNLRPEWQPKPANFGGRCVWY
jgi:hypothetical protein